MSDKQGVLVFFRAQPNKVEEVAGILTRIRSELEQESGCLRAQLFQDAVEPTNFQLLEEWATMSDQDRVFSELRASEDFKELSSCLQQPPDSIQQAMSP